ncbi:DUF7089 family protein [Halobacterium zhouii]|uniref:DUF7089 family protein n=1 Tax=Halobacterium zhouii TaxID=2902624 RepID=UPI001E3BEFB5|nr:hypothetical protein [Halobacterium zhouii]
MFSERDLTDDLAGVRDAHAPGAVVLDCERDFETLPAANRDDLALLTDAITPHHYDEAWLPGDAPELLRRLTTTDFLVGAPGDGSVAWTTQTDPPVVFVKARTEGTPESFVDFLVAEALVEAGLDLPEQFLGFFEEQYRDFDAACDLDPATVYQLAVACLDAYRGLHTREVFREWDDEFPALYDAWVDAGERIAPRLEDLPRELAREETSFSDATELAVSGVKHDLELPAPFAALDTLAYRKHGAGYAVKWAEKVFE